MAKRVFEQSGPNGKAAVQRAIVLPFRKSLEISFKNLRVRFFRSMITISSLVLAVSFLSFVLVNLDVATGILINGNADTVRILRDAGYEIDASAHVVSMSAKERWIIILSMLVCAVGIVNAQLMSVTERFKEIGVMKCLGALDAMVLRLFLLEAAMQGFAGATAGAILGMIIAILSSMARFGLAAATSLPLADTLISAGTAALAGLLLSLAGVLYPAILAAKMPPINAIRAEH